MRKTICTVVFLCMFLNYQLHAECVLVPLPLKDRVAAASLIIEAKVTSKKSYWDQQRSMIYTASTLMISKVYKGAGLIADNSVNLITLGGTVGQKAIKVEPELETEMGEIGIFMLVMKDGEWWSESGPQGLIRIDKHTAEAADIFYNYPAFSIANTIQDLTQIKPVAINELLTKITFSNKRATPTITSISPQTITAGTSSVLTIKGSNFETTMDTNSVQFRNADDGGASYLKAFKYDYISWSDTMIKLIVRTKAGTGKIRVVIGGNGVVSSTDTLKITYAHLNVERGDSIGFETQEIGMNSNNGITWKMNKSFFDSTGARGAFIRSLERWRCGTFINWDTLGRVNYSTIKGDGVNICAWDTNGIMPNGVLAQCFSYWSGCFSPGLKWYVNELDIRFRVKPTNTTNWNYTSGNATSSQFHFESVATHELGHGHQMAHVINSAVVMHYSIANGQTKPNLSTDDIAGGNYVITKSTNSICGKNAHSKLNSGNCAMVNPNANFILSTTAVCKNDNLVFTDSSQGNISAYSWDFGFGASPATANTKGPHTVKYTTGGTKSITLTITTIQGSFQKTKTLQVSTDNHILPDFSFVAAEKGKLTFTNFSNNPINSKWYFGDGDSSTTISPLHTYPSGGSFNVRLIAENTCSKEELIKGISFAWLNFYSQQDTVCISQPVVYMDSSDNNVSTWQWTFSGGTPASATGKGPHKISYGTPGVKSVKLDIVNTAGKTQTYTRGNILFVETDTFTLASFKYGYYGKNIVGFENTSTSSNAAFKWYFGDGDSSSEKHPIHQYTNANNKTVKLVVTGACGTDDTTIQLRDFTSVGTLNTSSFFHVYPNPSDKYLWIWSPQAQEVQVEILDATGKLLMKESVRTGEKFSTAMLPEGLYIVKIYTDAVWETKKLLISH
jgi:PKD repeat protein